MNEFDRQASGRLNDIIRVIYDYYDDLMVSYIVLCGLKAFMYIS